MLLLRVDGRVSKISSFLLSFPAPFPDQRPLLPLIPHPLLQHQLLLAWPLHRTRSQSKVTQDHAFSLLCITSCKKSHTWFWFLNFNATVSCTKQLYLIYSHPGYFHSFCKTLHYPVCAIFLFIIFFKVARCSNHINVLFSWWFFFCHFLYLLSTSCVNLSLPPPAPIPAISLLPLSSLLHLLFLPFHPPPRSFRTCCLLSFS